ncbi:MAG: hypothetical protein MPW15_26295 [Candidatus Manganitrophus sp.]|nr:hypothetical protein [Candidatus Manganitrophus sp.]
MEEIEEILLNLVATAEAATSEELTRFLKSTYTAQRRWGDKIEDLERADRIGPGEVPNQGGPSNRRREIALSRPNLGQITVLKGIRLATAVDISRWMKATDPNNLTGLEILYALALTEDAKRIYVPLPYRERRTRNYPTLLRKEILHQQEGGKEHFSVTHRRRAAERSGGSARRQKSADSLRMDHLPIRPSEIEQSYDIHAGAIARIGEAFSRLAEAASALAREIGWTPETVRRLSELSERLLQGVTAQGLTLSRIRVRGLDRNAIARLVREGYDSPEALFSLPIEILEKYISRSGSPRPFTSI